MHKITIKTTKEVEIMRQGGRRLAIIRDQIKQMVKVGVSADSIDKKAELLIKEASGESSFKMVRNYSWTTCVNVNSGVVHGIPHSHIVFKEGDVVSVDLGMYYKGFHTDTSFTVDLGSGETSFLAIGKEALNAGINQAKGGNYVFDISNSIEKVLSKNKLSPVWNLVGHGIGRNLHEEPQIPCFVQESREKTVRILPGMVFAIEVMYTKGNGKIKNEDDGWTISTEDGKISALYEETVLITKNGNEVLTEAN